ncbi:hypothetical protein DKM44_12165 [Deinococcus irradiatisoli]|uniref:Uncharacterized protein n=1 Tax=Deinococcus irradiatisoli TaxID=2202254 RepID=A0A2Z3JR94_9DEIO|nr:hypothetical protein [Deinococcus irradiatisoli]AWN23888.1 hypothetical protein DKM44_12165 [Deinococcus irradiatisoli]
MSADQNNRDPKNDLSVPGDPKDNHEEHYTTAPPEDRVGTQDRGIGGIQNQEDHQSGQGAQTFKGRDPLVTRDPVEFEHMLQGAAYAGAEGSVGDLGPVPPAVSVPGELSAGVAAMPGAGVVPGATLGGVVTPDPFLARDIDPNASYTPPSEEVSSHPNEGAADVPAGSPSEQYLESNLNDTVSTDKDRS